jgi:hypothetical protein
MESKKTEVIYKKWQAEYRSRYEKYYKKLKKELEGWQVIERLKSRREAIEDERSKLGKKVQTLAQLLLKDPLKLAFEDLTFQAGYDFDRSTLMAAIKKEGKIRPLHERLQKRFDSVFGSDKKPPSVSVLMFDVVKEKMLTDCREFLELTGETMDIETGLTSVFQPYRRYVEKYFEWETLSMFISELERDKTPSNRNTLDVADIWIRPLIIDIKALDLPNHRDVERVFYKHFPALKVIDRLPWQFAQGEIKKEPIAEAIKFIFEIKHPTESITPSAIVKRYERSLLW